MHNDQDSTTSTVLSTGKGTGRYDYVISQIGRELEHLAGARTYFSTDSLI